MKTQSNDVLEQIYYLKELAEESRVKIAVGYPFFFLWGVIWLVGYLSMLFIPGKMMSSIWLTYVIIGVIGTIIFGERMRRRREPAPALLKKLGWLTLLLWIMSGILFILAFCGSLNINLISAYWPFQFGIIYLANSIFLDRQLTIVGCWLLFTALVSLIIPVPYLYIWLSLAGGGSLIFTGYVFRKQVLRVG